MLYSTWNNMVIIILNMLFLLHCAHALLTHLQHVSSLKYFNQAENFDIFPNFEKLSQRCWWPIRMLIDCSNLPWTFLRGKTRFLAFLPQRGKMSKYPITLSEKIAFYPSKMFKEGSNTLKMINILNQSSLSSHHLKSPTSLSSAGQILLLKIWFII